MDFEGLFQAVEKEMRARLEAARFAIKHGGLKGAIVEDVVRHFFERYLPDNLAVETGLLVDSTGSISRQLDIIICDRAKTPSLFIAGGVKVIPIECAYAVIEVKTVLSKIELEKCFENMASCKNLQRLACYEDGVIVTPCRMYGREHQDWQLMYFVFSFESAEPVSLMNQLNALSAKVAVDKTIDAVFILERGVIANWNSGGIDALPEPDSKRVWIKNNGLLLFYLLCSRYFNQIHLRKFNLLPYMKKINFGVPSVSSVKWDGSS